MATKLSTRAILLSLFLGLAVFTGKPVATHGGGTKDAVADKVRKIVATAIQDNPGVGPALIRLLFHDCWVQVRD
jgi:peroxidase